MSGGQTLETLGILVKGLFLLLAFAGMWWVFGWIESLAQKMPRRAIRRRSLRMQKFLFRGRYFWAGRGSSLTRPAKVPFISLFRLFLVLITAFGIVAIVRELIEAIAK